MNLLKGSLHGTLIPTPKDHMDSISILLGYTIHLTHNFLNHPYPLLDYKRRLISMVEKVQIYVVELTFWPRSVG